MNKVACVNFGNKYPKEYTDRLFSMVSRNTTEPFEFYVLTDNVDLYPNYNVIDISQYEERGWWTKLLMFRPGVLPRGKYLYLDLDVVIVDNIDSLFKLPTFGILRDFIRPDAGILPGPEYNSSVMIFEPQQHKDLFKYYKMNKEFFQGLKKDVPFIGDQNVISSYLNSHPGMCKPIPDEEIWSYKKSWERGKHRGDRSKMFGDTIPPKGKICVFHGVPNPTDVDTDWVKEHYK